MNFIYNILDLIDNQRSTNEVHGTENEKQLVVDLFSNFVKSLYRIQDQSKEYERNQHPDPIFHTRGYIKPYKKNLSYYEKIFNTQQRIGILVRIGTNKRTSLLGFPLLGFSVKVDNELAFSTMSVNGFISDVPFFSAILRTFFEFNPFVFFWYVLTNLSKITYWLKTFIISLQTYLFKPTYNLDDYTYYSITPWTYGNKYIKFLTRPNKDVSDNWYKSVGSIVQNSAKYYLYDHDSYIERQRKILSKRNVEFDLYIQFGGDKVFSPINNLTKLWTSKPIKVGTIVIPKTDNPIYPKINDNSVNFLVTGNATKFCEPVGDFNELRNRVYNIVAKIRNEHNKNLKND